MKEKVQRSLEKIFDVPFGVSSDKELAGKWQLPYRGCTTSRSTESP